MNQQPSALFSKGDLHGQIVVWLVFAPCRL